ncbi:hypothetical protein [Jiulongibacter sediminis]|uniref:Addiction module toxin RelE n=1 Tax=Jiulongibacter sediminis TaxID=1605367 RepID=A0A0P7BHU4_9BACT|nr:hypothetical protein [Jiulongibacter sediminis]KPM46587.1 hypothetical protein AFM12_19210 [Jiulongibacter sediminis]TBX21160.1 hypothetical protein TK44_19215 [Jiulongibacter sediminis]
MKWKLVMLEEYSGNHASVYSVILNEENGTLYENFIEENLTSFKSEIQDIHKRLVTIGTKTGAREGFFKRYEGKPGDGVCALFDKPNSKLRLYCIRIGNDIVILGGGGPKSKKIKALQEDKKLTKENAIIKKVSAQLTELIKQKDIRYSTDGLKLEGQLEFDDEEQ